jgi:hypothetical protein
MWAWPWARWMIAAVLVVGLAGGCTATRGTVRALASRPSPTGLVPPEHACYASSGPTVSRSVACTKGHAIETVHTGAFTGAAASASGPPVVGEPARGAAYQDCGRVATGFLGDDWRTGQVNLLLSVPTREQWAAGGRWYRCDLIFSSAGTSIGDTTPDFNIVESMQGGLTEARSYALGCADINDVKIWPLACTREHNGEFVGIFEAPDLVYPADEARWEMEQAGCYRLIAAFLGTANNAELGRRVGRLFGDYGPEPWTMGNHAVVCYLYLGHPLQRSLKGTGLPPR